MYFDGPGTDGLPEPWFRCMNIGYTKFWVLEGYSGTCTDVLDWRFTGLEQVLIGKAG